MFSRIQKSHNRKRKIELEKKELGPAEDKPVYSVDQATLQCKSNRNNSLKGLGVADGVVSGNLDKKTDSLIGQMTKKTSKGSSPPKFHAPKKRENEYLLNLLESCRTNRNLQRPPVSNPYMKDQIQKSISPTKTKQLFERGQTPNTPPHGNKQGK